MTVGRSLTSGCHGGIGDDPHTKERYLCGDFVNVGGRGWRGSFTTTVSQTIEEPGRSGRSRVGIPCSPVSVSGSGSRISCVGYSRLDLGPGDSRGSLLRKSYG